MLIYRLEDEKHIGPYRSEKKNKYEYNRNFPGNCHETLWEVLYLYHYSDDDLDKFICGCTSEEQLIDWFTEECIYELMEYGFTIRVYDCPDDHIIVRTHQVFFRKEFAKIIQ
jgi:hypothetical protein